jgi:hypothetical protein
MKTKNMKTPGIGNSINHSSLPRRSPATVGGRWACRAVVPQRREEGGPLITYRYPAAPARSKGGSLLTVLLLAFYCFGLCSALEAVTPAPDGGYANENTAEGTNALFHLTTGDHNTAVGFEALLNNTTGSANTAIGHNVLQSNTSGIHNTGIGGGVLAGNSTGSENTASGRHALQSNVSGNFNTATGGAALSGNTTGSSNTASGYQALGRNLNGFDNAADGYQALGNNTTGYWNTATGFQALGNNSSGHWNTADGYQALGMNTTGFGNIGLGLHAGANLTTGNSNIDIGNVGVAAESSTIRVGTVGTQTKAFIAGIHGVGVTGTAVVVSSSGQLGVAPSSQRFKADIRPMDKASETILALKPVSFHYKQEVDPEGIPQFGLVAEEVEKVNPALVVRDAEGKVFTVRYEAVNAMLLNEFLKEHRKVQDLQKQVEKLTAGLQKVSDELELRKSARQVVGND